MKPSRVPRIIQKSHLFPLVTTSHQDMVRAGIYLIGALYHEVHKLSGTLRKVSCRLVYVDGLETSREIHLGELNREEEYAAATARMLEHLPLRRVQLRLLQLRCPVDFEAAEQQDLFSERDRLKRRDLEQALKDVREKYGVEALHRASGTARRRVVERPVP